MGELAERLADERHSKQSKAWIAVILVLATAATVGYMTYRQTSSQSESSSSGQVASEKQGPAFTPEELEEMDKEELQIRHAGASMKYMIEDLGDHNEPTRNRAIGQLWIVGEPAAKHKTAFREACRLERVDDASVQLRLVILMSRWGKAHPGMAKSVLGRLATSKHEDVAKAAKKAIDNIKS
jgi:hypothetical protein